jgi:parallel beta-helix repeat protein
MVELRKTISIFLLISCLLSVPSLAARETLAKASSVALVADPISIFVPDNYTTIQEAINNATSGMTIFVRKGTYLENVVINKTITLVGEDSDLTIINGQEIDNVIHITAENVTVRNFTVRRSGLNAYSGISIDHSTGNMITDNKIINNYEGIGLLYSTNNVVSDNTVSNNYDGGVYLYFSSDNVVSGNTVFSNSYDGIDLFYSSNNVVSDNTISHNDLAGLRFFYSSNNAVFGNTIASNYPGISLALLSSNNNIYHNNFNNTFQASSQSTNVWNYGNEGNYWSNYSGQDLNKDGIGDAPYTIDPLNKDNYPLMGMFSEFTITLEGEMYEVTVISNSTISVFRFQIGEETGNKIMNFNATGADGTLGFCRVKLPTELMSYPHIVLINGEEILPTTLNISTATFAYLYFTYLNKNRTVTIISSKTLALYLELLDAYLTLQENLQDLNQTYNVLLQNYNNLLSNYAQLQVAIVGLNYSYQNLYSLNTTYYQLIDDYLKLRQELDDLNETYLNHLLEYNAQMQNIQNISYILVALAGTLIITTVYLSRRKHSNTNIRTKAIEEK